MDEVFVMKRFLRKLVNLNIWGGRYTIGIHNIYNY